MTREQQQLVEKYTPLALSIARKMSCDDEAESLALYALCQTIPHLHPTHPIPHLRRRIRQAIKRGLTRREQTGLDLDRMEDRRHANGELPVTPALQAVAQMRANGYPVEEIARETGLSERVVKQRLRQIREQLENSVR